MGPEAAAGGARARARRRVLSQRSLIFLLLVLGAASGCVGLRALPETFPIHQARAEEGWLRAGAAAVDITPEGRVWMGGFGFWRRSRGVHDPIYARALVLERGDFQLALVSLDVVGLQREDRLRLDAGITEAGFHPRHVIVSATHNHHGPDTIGLWGLPPFYSGQGEAVMEGLRAGVLEALARARAELRPAELATGARSLETQGVMKNLRRPGVVDPELVVLHVRELGGGDTIGTLVELGCHPEVLDSSNRQITADFPAWTVSELEAALGGVGIFVSGALGGLMTPDVVEHSYAEAERLGRQVGASGVDVVRELTRYERAPALALWHAPLVLRNENWRYDVVKATGILDRRFYRGGHLVTEVNLLEIGPLRAATVPGEITPDLGLRLKRALGGNPSLLIGLANDELGYLLPEADFHLPIYDYERGLSPSAQSGDHVVQRLEDLILLREATQER